MHDAHTVTMIVLLWSIMFDQNPTTVFAFFFSKQKVIPKLWTVSTKIFKALEQFTHLFYHLAMDVLQLSA